MARYLSGYKMQQPECIQSGAVLTFKARRLALPPSPPPEKVLSCRPRHSLTSVSVQLSHSAGTFRRRALYRSIGNKLYIHTENDL